MVLICRPLDRAYSCIAVVTQQAAIEDPFNRRVERRPPGAVLLERFTADRCKSVVLPVWALLGRHDVTGQQSLAKQTSERAVHRRVTDVGETRLPETAHNVIAVAVILTQRREHESVEDSLQQ